MDISWFISNKYRSRFVFDLICVLPLYFAYDRLAGLKLLRLFQVGRLRKVSDAIFMKVTRFFVCYPQYLIFLTHQDNLSSVQRTFELQVFWSLQNHLQVLKVAEKLVVNQYYPQAPFCANRALSHHELLLDLARAAHFKILFRFMVQDIRWLTWAVQFRYICPRDVFHHDSNHYCGLRRFYCYLFGIRAVLSNVYWGILSTRFVLSDSCISKVFGIGMMAYFQSNISYVVTKFNSHRKKLIVNVETTFPLKIS